MACLRCRGEQVVGKMVGEDAVDLPGMRRSWERSRLDA
jgi:hypothetical protein